MPKIFLISSPSGGGEDSVIQGLKKCLRFKRVVTTVTRPMFKGEKQGKPYYFVSVKKFKGMLKKNEFIEWAHVYGNYRGCAKNEIQRLLGQNLPIIWKVDWQGVITIKKQFPKALAIFISPPSYKILEKRLLARGRDTRKEIQRRKKFTQEWLKKKHLYDFVALNREGRLKETVKKVCGIIKKNSE